MAPEQCLHEVHDSNVALWLALSTPASNRRALPAELIHQILEDPSRWAVLHMEDKYVFNTYDKIATPHIEPMETPPLTFGVRHIRRIELHHKLEIKDTFRIKLGRNDFRSKWRGFALGVRNSGSQEVSNWHVVPAKLESPDRLLALEAPHWSDSWDYRGSIDLDHPIFNEINDGDIIIARACMSLEENLYSYLDYVMHTIRMEIIGVDVCSELRPGPRDL